MCLAYCPAGNTATGYAYCFAIRLRSYAIAPRQGAIRSAVRLFAGRQIRLTLGYAYCFAIRLRCCAIAPRQGAIRSAVRLFACRQIRLTNLYTAIIFQKASIHSNSKTKCSHFPIYSHKIDEKFDIESFSVIMRKSLGGICRTFIYTLIASPHQCDDRRYKDYAMRKLLFPIIACAFLAMACDDSSSDSNEPQGYRI